MDIFIYSDESGVFDVAHNDIFVFGGLIFLSKDERDRCARMYSSAENIIRQKENKTKAQEIKATTISNSSKGKLYRSFNNWEKFGVVINQNKILPSIFLSKKSKQRYLDYAYKIAVKRKFEALICSGDISPNEIKHLFFYVDEHTTATDGLYELKEGLEQEFRFGTYSMNYSIFYPPIFPFLQSVDVSFCNSASNTLVRAADIVSNKFYYQAQNNNIPKSNEHLTLTQLP